MTLAMNTLPDTCRQRPAAVDSTQQSQVEPRFVGSALAGAAGLWCGAGRVKAVTPGGWLVQLEDQAATRVVAEVGLAWDYEPLTGDVLQVVGDLTRCYVIGVVRGEGRTRLRAPELTVKAAGALRLRGRQRRSWQGSAEFKGGSMRGPWR